MVMEKTHLTSRDNPKSERTHLVTAGATHGFRPLEVKLWGDLACFTRPEMKVERVSYPVMTPSAARGALESIFWKPQFRWVIEEIVVLNPIRYFSIVRNEITRKSAHSRAYGWMNSGTGGFSATQNRTQRHTLAIRDVAYIVRARIALNRRSDEHPARYRDQFRRRVRRGSCFATPYLGCREFPASFGPPDGSEQSVDISTDLGRMLLDLRYDPDGSGRGAPVFFEATLERGVLRVPLMSEVLTV